MIDQLKDALQMAANGGAFICPIAGRPKPPDHVRACLACRVREWLTPGWWLYPETEMEARLHARAAEYRGASARSAEAWVSSMVDVGSDIPGGGAA